MSGPQADGSGKWDLEKAAAENGAANEATHKPTEFAYKGTDYSIPPMRTWKMSAIRAVGLGDFDTALPEIIGYDTYERMLADGLTLGEMQTLFERCSEESGMGGEDGQASRGNSSRRRRPASTRT